MCNLLILCSLSLYLGVHEGEVFLPKSTGKSVEILSLPVGVQQRCEQTGSASGYALMPTC